jgi:hypothetical protein
MNKLVNKELSINEVISEGKSILDFIYKSVLSNNNLLKYFTTKWYVVTYKSNKVLIRQICYDGKEYNINNPKKVSIIAMDFDWKHSATSKDFNIYDLRFLKNIKDILDEYIIWEDCEVKNKTKEILKK